ncbi:MAG: hypothetical protein A2X86_21515 [Bdellovibrionales bacterium GWA2_49_15]|nr:MAG: hypothetical protein A2X86_21515 [Bdellovibrionales bacterium GWA2_49_15]HAZ14959.1 hypothetical protein [Bdellovibrionales bacterium]
MERGEIWYAVWPADPGKKERPVLIVSNAYRNRAKNLLDVVVVKLTGLHRTDNNVKPVNANEDVVIKLKKDTIIRCGSLYTIEKAMLKSNKGRLSNTVMKDVDEKLRNVLSL